MHFIITFHFTSSSVSSSDVELCESSPRGTAAILFLVKRHGLLFLLTLSIEQHTIPQKMADDSAGQEEQLTAAEVRVHYFTTRHKLEYCEVKCVTGEAHEQLRLHSVGFLVVGYPYRVVSVCKCIPH